MDAEEKRRWRFERRRQLMLYYYQMVQADALDDMEEALMAFRLGRTFTARIARASAEDLFQLSILGANGTLPLHFDETGAGSQLLLGQIQAMEDTAKIAATRRAVAVKSFSLTPQE